MEYYYPWLSDWIVDDDTITGTTHTVDDLHCDRQHWFQVSAYGSGTTYTATWSEPSTFLPETTAECETPVFGEESYEFAVRARAAAGATVGGGSESDTIPDEYIRISDMEQVAKVLTLTALNVCNLPP